MRIKKYLNFIQLVTVAIFILVANRFVSNIPFYTKNVYMAGCLVGMLTFFILDFFNILKRNIKQ